MTNDFSLDNLLTQNENITFRVIKHYYLKLLGLFALFALLNW